MQKVTEDSWKGRTIRICTVPVRRIITPDSLPDGYISTVRIERNCDVLVDWHIPLFGERWLSEGEARRDALEYAVKLIDSGVLGEPRESRDHAA